jgi:GNAT superfamily N-acetyltransferase
MNITITKAQSHKEIDSVFDGEAPHYHPDAFWNTRMQEQRVFLAKDGDNPIGLLCYNAWWGNTPFLELVHIQDAYQRQGIGTALVKQAIQEIKSQNFKRLTSSCEQDNDDSHKFHEALGFEKINSLMLPHGEEQFYSINLEKLV